MAKSNIPLKAEGTNGDLKELTPTEEHYLAYQAGLQLAAGTTDAGTLHKTTGTTIGTFVDTYYNEADGTHPASAITSGSTSTPLKQIQGTANYTGANYRRPVGYLNSGAEGLYEFPDSDMSILTTRLNARIALSDYPGTYKLGTSAPSSDYSALLSNVYTDTLGNGTSTVYNIYKRNTMSAPSTIRPMGLVGSDSAGSFSGIRELNDNEIKHTFGQHAKTERAVVGNIGSYQLRSATQGVPSASGTWAAKGTATNTKRTTSEVAYTRTRASAYTRTRGSAYARTRTSAYTRNSLQTFTGTYAGDFVGNYTRAFAGNYARNFAGNYVGDFIGNYQRTRVSQYTTNFTDVFTRNFVGNYQRIRVSNYTRDRITVFTGNFIGNYVRTRISAYARTSTRTRNSNYIRTRTSAYTTVFAGNYVGDFVGNYSRTRVSGYSGAYTRIRNSAYIRTRTSTYTRDRVTNFTGDFIGNYSRNRVSAYTRTSTRTRTSAYARTRISTYTRDSLQTFTGNFLGN